MKNILFPKDLVASNELLGGMVEMFGAEFLEKLARETKFIQRSTSSITGQMFLAANVFQERSLQGTSLNDHCDFFKDEHEVTLKKQSLDERYNTYAVSFMKRCFGHVVSEVLVKHQFANLATRFGRIRVTDSTSFQLPAALAVFYQGNGGDASDSTIKIHYEYDLITGNFLDISIVSGRENDADHLKATSVPFQKGELLIKDLGYYQHLHFKEIHSAGAFFISRYKSRTNLYTKNAKGKWEKADMAEVLGSITALTDWALSNSCCPVRAREIWMRLSTCLMAVESTVCAFSEMAKRGGKGHFS